MLFNNSPVKNVSEKLKSPQTSIKNIKFERKKDFKSFLSYIEREAKALDAIQLPRRNEIQKKKRSGLGAVLGFGALGLLGLFGGAGSDSKRNDYKYIDEGGKSGIDLGPMGRRQEGESDSDSSDIKKDSPITPTDIKNFAKNNLDVMSDVTRAASYAVNKKYNKQIELEKKKEINNEAKQEAKKEAKKEESRSRGRKRTVRRQVGGDSINKTTTATDTKSRGRYNKNYGPGGEVPLQPNDRDIIRRAFSTADDLTINSVMNNPILPETVEFLVRTGQAKFDKVLELHQYKNISGQFVYFSQLSEAEQIKIVAQQLELQKDIAARMSKNAYKQVKMENDVKSEKGLFQKKKRGSGLFSRLPFSSTLSKSLSKPALGTEPIKLLKAIRKSGLIKGVKTYAPGKLKTVLFGVDLALTGSAEMDSISKISLRNNIVTALFDLLGPSSNVNRMAEILNEPGLLIPKVYQGQEGTYIYRDNKIINENIRKIKESNKKDFTMSDIYKGVTGDAEILNRIMHGKKDVPKIETIPKIRPIDKYDFSDEYSSDVNIFSDLQELKGRK